MPKNATKWSTNPLSTTNQRVYDSTVIYDTTVTYDGITTGQSAFTTKKPTVWSVGSKTATQWLANSSLGSVDGYDTSSDTFDGGGSTSAFDSYDGVSAGQSILGTKKATVWSTT